MYRVFISYSHQDSQFVQRVVQVLKANGLTPMWDRDFAFGKGFHEQIKNFIKHSHIFIPIITTHSDKRKWVHQEIGYAMALNIPVLPLVIGKLQGGMLQTIQALFVSEEDIENLGNKLSKDLLDNLLNQYAHPSNALYKCAEFAEDRAAMMTQYCNDIISLGYWGLVRQKGGLSSFHIPDKSTNHPDWKARYATVTRSPAHCKLQREERLAFNKHAKIAGCKIIVNPLITFGQYGEKARIVRLKSLLEFLNSMPDESCQIAFQEEMEYPESITIVGDWFSAESVSARIGEGYRQTIFTRHAPSMITKITNFDLEFEEYLAMKEWRAETSRLSAIEAIEKIIAELTQ